MRWSIVMQQFYTFESSLWASFLWYWLSFGKILDVYKFAVLLRPFGTGYWVTIPFALKKIAYNTFFDVRALLAIVGLLMFFLSKLDFLFFFSGWKKCTNVSSPVTSSLSCLWSILLYIFNNFLHFRSRSFFCSFVRIWGIHLAHIF